MSIDKLISVDSLKEEVKDGVMNESVVTLVSVGEEESVLKLEDSKADSENMEWWWPW